MALGNPYTEVSIVNYNVTPPTDDGAQTAANTVEWTKHKDKLADPIKTLAESTQTNITAALDKRLLNDTITKTGAYTILVTDRGKIIDFTGSSPATFTLPAVADAKNGFELVVRNSGTAVLTIDGNASETIDGVTSIDLYPLRSLWLQCDGGTAWVVAAKPAQPPPGVLAKTFSDTPYAVLVDDDGRVIDVDASGGAVTIDLPAAATAKNGFSITIKKTDSSTNVVTIDASTTETIDGALTATLPFQYRTLKFVCDGTEWHTASAVGSGGGLVLLQRATASASASVEFKDDIDTTYDTYIIDYLNVRPATNGAFLRMRVSDDNGSTYKSGGSDYFSGEGTPLSAQNRLDLSLAASNVADNFVVGRVYIYLPAASAKTHIGGHYGQFTASPNNSVAIVNWGKYDTVAATDAFEITMSSGNIAEGEFKLYGVEK